MTPHDTRVQRPALAFPRRTHFRKEKNFQREKVFGTLLLSQTYVHRPHTHGEGRVLATEDNRLPVCIISGLVCLPFVLCFALRRIAFFSSVVVVGNDMNCQRNTGGGQDGAMLADNFQLYSSISSQPKSCQSACYVLYVASSSDKSLQKEGAECV